MQLISTFFSYSVLCYREMHGRFPISKQQFTVTVLQGGGQGDGAPAPRALLNALHRWPLLGRPCTATLHGNGLTALPAAALEMGNAGPGCLFPRISRSAVPFARSEKSAGLLQLSFHWCIFHTAHVPTVAHE